MRATQKTFISEGVHVRRVLSGEVLGGKRVPSRSLFFLLQLPPSSTLVKHASYLVGLLRFTQVRSVAHAIQLVAFGDDSFIHTV